MRNGLLIIGFLAWACSGPVHQEKAQPSATPADIHMLPSPGDSTHAQGEPFLHTDPNGMLYLSWIEALDSATHRLQYARWQDTGWSASITIAQGQHWFVNWADFPQFASDGKGHYIATYLQKSGPGKYAYDIMLTTSANGIDWTKPKLLNEDGREAEHGFVSIAPTKDGFLVSWLDGRRTNPMPAGSHDHDHHDAGQMTLRAAQLDSNGNKIWEEEVDEKTCDCCQTSVANSTNGPLIVYRDRTDQEVRDIYVASRSNGRWETKALHDDGWEINGCPVNGPQMQAKGKTVAVAWYTEARKQPSVFTVFSTDGGRTFGNPIRIHDSIPLGRVDLVLADEETAIASWMEGDRILARSFRAEGTNSQPYLIARNNVARSAGFPQMTRCGNKLVFAWTDNASRRISTAVMDIQSFRTAAADH